MCRAIWGLRRAIWGHNLGHTHTRTDSPTHARTHARTHTHTHARARTHTHTHTHTNKPPTAGVQLVGLSNLIVNNSCSQSIHTLGSDHITPPPPSLPHNHHPPPSPFLHGILPRATYYPPVLVFNVCLLGKRHSGSDHANIAIKLNR